MASRETSTQLGNDKTELSRSLKAIVADRYR